MNENRNALRKLNNYFFVKKAESFFFPDLDNPRFLRIALLKFFALSIATFLTKLKDVV